MTNYTADDVRYLIPETLTRKQAEGIEAYLNSGTIPAADPCAGCDPNLIRKYISRIQKAEREGSWPPAGRIDGELNAQEPAEGYTAGLALTNPDEGGYVAGEIPEEELAAREPETGRRRKTKAE